ncbi:uncharacterized protein LOC133183303 [Saccostrea echinata]|uniref:uncharacterized protein LOC133183303 n=1 Tax=Saccostrea echinata TaxID=191078 RepID=UPI002A7F69F6|nr:uncharacterized protein LOC133183303 [Saccostrea echinata]
MPSMKTDREGKTTYAEISAMKFNLKEERCLKKNLQLLGVEEDYSLTLVNLDNRGVKLYQKKLKDKVSKIKSNLTPTEITEFQKLDEAGKLKGIYPSVTPNLQGRITAEAKRLNLDLPMRPRTAIPLRRSYSTNTPRQPPRPSSEKRQLPRRESLKNGLSETSKYEKEETKDSIKGAIGKSSESSVPSKVQVNNYTISNQNETSNNSERKTKLPPRGDYPSLRSPLKRHSSERKTISASAHVRKRFLDDHRLSIVKEDNNLIQNEEVNGENGKPNGIHVEGNENVSNSLQEAVGKNEENECKIKTIEQKRPFTRPESRMDVVRDNLIDSTTPSILSLDSGSALDLDMVEPTKGKMKLMATKTFTAEEVKELNKRRSQSDISSQSFYECSSSRTTKHIDVSRSSTPTIQILENSQITPRKHVRPTASFSSYPEKEKFKNTTPRSQTANVSRTRTMPLNSPKPTIQRSKSSLSGCINPTKAMFSSHAPKDGTRSRRLPGGRTTFLSNEIGDDLGNNLQAEIRHDLLVKEHEVRSIMDKKVSNYLNRLGKFLDKK